MAQIQYVLDASAVLAVLNSETGQQVVIPLLGDSAICAVNLAEVGTKLIEAGMDSQTAQIAVSVLGIGSIIDFDTDLSWETAQLRPLTKSRGLSLGDRCCLALGIKLNVPVVTADKEWAKLSVCQTIIIR